MTAVADMGGVRGDRVQLGNLAKIRTLWLHRVCELPLAAPPTSPSRVERMSGQAGGNLSAFVTRSRWTARMLANDSSSEDQC